MAASQYLSVPTKTTNEVDLIKPLQKFINVTFSDIKSEDYQQSLNDFNKLRSQTISKLGDKHESTLDVLYRYYDQLVAIESKLPITENQIRVNFKWYAAFSKGGLFGRESLSVASGLFEKVSIMYNIAAIQSQIADTQNHNSDDGLKTAAKYFQMSSGIFSHLKDCILSHIQLTPTSDMSPDTLAALSSIMLAQAQDCFFRKARKDKMKDAVVAKVAMQCCDLYADAASLFQIYSLKSLWPKDWIPFVVCRQKAFHALAEFYQAQAVAETKLFGEQICRYEKSLQLMNEAEKRGESTFKFHDELSRIKRQLETVKKDNDFIYHETIPNYNTLSPIGKAAIAKSLPVNSPMSSNFKDLFAKLVPLAVHEALGVFDSRKGEIINTEVTRLREATQLLNSVLTSLNLPAGIEDLTSGGKLPESVLEKASKIQQLGGISLIEKIMQELPESLQRNREILDECFRMLDDEQTSDQQLRTQFTVRWTRTPSEKLTESLRAEIAKYVNILDTAVQADSVVKDKYASLRNGMYLLSKSPGDLEASLPSAAQQAQLSNSPSVKKLHELMGQVEIIKAERETMEAEIKDSSFNMASKFLSAMASDGIINQESISEGELDTRFGPLRVQVSESIHRQEALLSEIQSANSEFAQVRQSNQSAANRDKVLKDLAEAYDGYMELKSNLEEGNKFYCDLTDLLLRCQGKISDFCFARKTEKEELMKDLQKSIVSQPSQPSPTVPSYHQPPHQPPHPQPPSNSSQRQAPPRPPPPSTGTSSISANTTAPPVYAAASTAQPAYQPSTAPPYPYGQYQPPPPMPMGYNPYAAYGQQQLPQQQGYPGYPPSQQPQQFGYPPPYQQQMGYPPQNPGYQPQNNPYRQW